MKAGTRLASEKRISHCSSSPSSSDETDLQSDSSATSISQSESASPEPLKPVANLLEQHSDCVSALDRFCQALIETHEIKKAVGNLKWQPLTYAHVSEELNLSYPLLFNSVCICDPKISGYPIQQHSAKFDLGSRGLTVGACRFLNLPYSYLDSCNLFTEADSTGKLKFILEYAGNLVSSKDGPTEYVIVAKMDMTPTIRKLGLKVVNAGFSSWSSMPTSDLDSSIDWLEAAQENPTPPPSSDPAIVIPPPILHEFAELIKDLRFFHRDCFTLLENPISGEWKMPWVSPSLAANEDDLKVAMWLTPNVGRDRLSAGLNGGKRMCITVRWGVRGGKRRVYLVPMERDEGGYWVGYLLPIGIPDLWRL